MLWFDRHTSDTHHGNAPPAEELAHGQMEQSSCDVLIDNGNPHVVVACDLEIPPPLLARKGEDLRRKAREGLELLQRGQHRLQTFLVLSATSRLSTLDETVSIYEQSNMSGCILTKLDETTSFGSALSAVTEHGLPICFYSDGQRVPEDLHAARAIDLVRSAVTTMHANEDRLEAELFTYKAGRAVADARF